VRRLIVTEFVTVDGVMEAPEKWVFEFMNDAIRQFKVGVMHDVDTLLLGRATPERSL
jgi:hypothetical protein